MTGVENNGMTFIKNIKLGLLTSIIMPAVGITFSVQAAMTDSVTVTLNSTFTNPGCTVDAPRIVNLGNMPVGDTKYPSFDISINCKSNVKTALYAQANVYGDTGISNNPDEPGDALHMTSTPAQGGANVILTLMHNNQIINFNYNYFCDGENNRKCSVSPKTRVRPSLSPGVRTGRVLFTIMYI